MRAAFCLSWVLECGLGVVEPLLPEEHTHGPAHVKGGKVTGGGCFFGDELCGLVELDLIGGKDLVGSRGAPLVQDPRRKLVSHDVIGEVSFGGGGDGVGGEVEENHRVAIHVLDCGHIVTDLSEKVEGLLVVTLCSGRDGII